MSHLDDFLSTKSKLQAFRARAALEVVCYWNNADPMSRASRIEKEVARGRKVVTTQKGERRLMDESSGVFYDEKATTKTGMDYAVFLLGKGART